MAVEPRPPLSPEAFQALTGVSDDTLARLAAYVELLGKWQRRINLVGRGNPATSSENPDYWIFRGEGWRMDCYPDKRVPDRPQAFE